MTSQVSPLQWRLFDIGVAGQHLVGEIKNSLAQLSPTELDRHSVKAALTSALGVALLVANEVVATGIASRHARTPGRVIGAASIMASAGIAALCTYEQWRRPREQTDGAWS